MKTYPLEIARFEKYAELHAGGIISPEQELLIQDRAKDLRNWGKKHRLAHFCLQLFPFIFLFSLWAMAMLAISSIHPAGELALIAYSVFRGLWGYSFVVYALHEGAGHQLFPSMSILNKACFHSSRLFFADPVYYRQRHIKHHLYLGTSEDGAFTHYVLTSRIIKSLLPLFGTIIPHDYVIYKGTEITPSALFSVFVGGIVLAAEVALLHSISSWSYLTLLLHLLVLAPWVGIVLERLRESLEHHLMPKNISWGARELGLRWWGILLGGGPWGQPCHLSHHLAGDLNWYQQILLHRHLLKILTPEQKKIFIPESLSSLLANWIKGQQEIQSYEIS